MIPITNPQTNISEYIDNPSSLDQKNNNIKIVRNIITKLKSNEHQYNGRDNTKFNLLKPHSQALKNNILEEISILIIKQQDKPPIPVHKNPHRYLSKLLAIGAEITDKAEQNLFSCYTQHLQNAQKSSYDREHNTRIANEVRGFLKPGRVLLEIEQKLDNLYEKLDNLQQQTTDLQTQADKINKKVTQIENRQKQCCRCTIL